ncbi:MAG: (deoxy)nucleoside triphosphate pyrophosphohydrolase [Desulfovibrio sp.]|nr:(deoxy)nucleoside triphosphate pyrophosphohydrolase [Desulfovibrio sp.]
MRHIEVAAGIIWRNGCFLAAQRRTGSPMEGFWEFPGGKLEGSENALEALHRELAEELGISIRKALFWKNLEHDYFERGFSVLLHFFHVTAFTGEPCGKEGQNVRWVTPQEALELGFLPADAHLLEELVCLQPCV